MDRRIILHVAAQEDCVAYWQLRDDGFTAKAIEWLVRDWRLMQDGVWSISHAPPARRQRMWAAALTTRGSWVSFASAAHAWGFRPVDMSFEVVSRVGNGGPRRMDKTLLVCRSSGLQTTTQAGLPIVTPERTVADLWRSSPPRPARKMLREAIRLRCLTPSSLREHLDTEPARRRPTSLVALLDRYGRLQLVRCRSDAEAYAVELIDAAGLPLPQINVRIAGEEADLSWPQRRKVLEIDGDHFHQDKAEDARKTAAWRRAGHQVRRVESDVVFDEPERFVAGVRRMLAD